MPIRIERKKPRVQLLPFLTSSNPSKNYIFNLLYAVVQRRKPGRSLDAGCGELRNRWMFPNAYFGITIEHKGYFRGLEYARQHSIQQTGPTTVYLMRLESDFSFIGAMDMVVCTNTIFYVADPPGALARLAERVDRGGALFVNNPLLNADGSSGLDQFLAVLEPLFEELRVVFTNAEGIDNPPPPPQTMRQEVPDADILAAVPGLTALEMNMPNTPDGHEGFCIIAHGKRQPAAPPGLLPPMLSDRGLLVVEPSLMVVP